jgi:hypothetical protein
MRKSLALALMLAATLPSRVWAAGDEDEEEDTSSEDEESSDEDEEAAADEKAKPEKEEPEADVIPDAGLRPKQNLTGHDLGTKKTSNEFERDRFFVDKVDSAKTEKGTLIQGSIASSSFFYKEMGGAYPAPATATNAAGPSRLFTELRLQTDFRHISASRWEARVDTRIRAVAPGGDQTPPPGGPAPTQATPEDHIQSGFLGQNAYEIRELWLTRVGKRSDIFIGRQFVPDLGGFKFDGLRIDYAKSAKLTLIGVAGLFPLRGSRSIDSDYAPLKTVDGASAGRFVATGGFGAAYRTINAYGAIGGVAQVPLQKEQPRFYVTTNGYLRSGSKLDLYHFVILDLLGTAAQESTSHIGLTNVSAGANFKLDARLRLTASVNRVDTETLAVQAGEFLGTVDTKAMDPTYGGNKVVQNEAALLRLATNQARAGVSAGLGKLQRFELSTAATYRQRQEFTLTTADPTVASITIPAAKSVELWGSIVDRRSFKGARIGLDVARSFGLGGNSYQHSNTQTYRVSVLREFAEGRGEWEGDITYATVLNDAASSMTQCTAGTMNIEQQINICYGNSNNKLISGGGQVVYRLKPDWLAIANLYVLRTANKSLDGAGKVVTDPTITGFTGFLRIAKRF